MILPADGTACGLPPGQVSPFSREETMWTIIGAGTAALHSQIGLSQCVRQRPVKSQVASLHLEMTVNASGGRGGRSPRTKFQGEGGDQEYTAESQ